MLRCNKSVFPKRFGHRPPFANIFFTDPNLMVQKVSAQPMRKDNSNPKINNTKSVKKNKLLQTGVPYFQRGKPGHLLIESNLCLKRLSFQKNIFT